MSVLIKNLSIPKNGYVNVTIFPDSKATVLTDEPPFNYKEFEAVEVPTSHGDLIDGDELYREVAKAHAYEHLSVKRIIAMIRNSSTVIEAEE